MWLYVDVAGATAHGFGDDARGEPDSRPLVGRTFQVVLIDGFGFIGDVRQLGVLVEDRPHAAKLGLDLRVGAHHHRDRCGSGVQPDVVEGDHVGRIGRRHPDRVVVATDHQHAVALGDAARQRASDAEVEREFCEVDQFEMHQVGERVRKLALRKEALVDDDPTQSAPAAAFHALLLGQRVAQLFLGQQAVRNKQLAKASAPVGLQLVAAIEQASGLDRYRHVRTPHVSYIVGRR